MKLITEEVQKVKFITEGKGAKKKMYIEGIFLQGDLKNRNGRMYPVSTLAKEVGRYKIEVTTYTSKKGNVYVLETIFDTKLGKGIERKRFYHSKYGEKKRR